jgi:hypothetical protein
MRVLPRYLTVTLTRIHWGVKVWIEIVDSTTISLEQRTQFDTSSESALNISDCEITSAVERFRSGD